jgi:hypothetical protein
MDISNDLQEHFQKTEAYKGRRREEMRKWRQHRHLFQVGCKRQQRKGTEDKEEYETEDKEEYEIKGTFFLMQESIAWFYTGGNNPVKRINFYSRRRRNEIKRLCGKYF